jgi:hypothetical protein
LIFLSLFWPSLIPRWRNHFWPFHDVSLCLALSKTLTQSSSDKNADALSRRKIFKRPKTGTSAHAWPYDRTGIPITYARKNAAPCLWMYEQWAIRRQTPIALIRSMQILSTV